MELLLAHAPHHERRELSSLTKYNDAKVARAQLHVTADYARILAHCAEAPPHPLIHSTKEQAITEKDL